MYKSDNDSYNLTVYLINQIFWLTKEKLLILLF